MSFKLIAYAGVSYSDSRAQHGMYIIGNTDTASRIPMWQQVIGMLKAKDAVGNAFELCCPRHPDTIITASEPEVCTKLLLIASHTQGRKDFEAHSPEGGCNLQCEK